MNQFKGQRQFGVGSYLFSCTAPFGGSGELLLSCKRCGDVILSKLSFVSGGSVKTLQEVGVRFCQLVSPR